MPRKTDAQVKALLRKTVRLDKSSWYGKWILGFHGIWRGLSSGMSEVSLVLGGRWVPAGFHRKVLCSSMWMGLPPTPFLLLPEELVSLHTPPLCPSPPWIYNPVFCAIKSCPSRRIFVENIVQCVYVTNPRVFFFSYYVLVMILKLGIY